MTSGTSSRRDGSLGSAPGRPRPPRRTAGRGWLLLVPLVAALAVVLGLLAGGGAPEEVAPGIPDPGAVTGWGLPLMRVLFDLAAVVVIGGLVTTLLLPREDFNDRALPALTVAAWAAWAWVVSSAASVLLTVSDVLGIPPRSVLSGGRLWPEVWEISQARAFLFVLAIAIVVGSYARWTSTRAGAAWLLAGAVAGLLPVLFAGHSAAAADHDLATSSMVVHVVGASVWVGGLVGVLGLLHRRPRMLAEVLPRYSALALICFVAVALSGAINAWTRTFGDLTLWVGSGYGYLVAGKISGLVALGLMGRWHRRRTMPALAGGRPGAFARLAIVEVAVMAATVGVAVALARTPPPIGAEAVVPAHGLGHPTLGDEVLPFTFARLFTEWRPEAIWLLLIAVAFGSYLAGVRRLRREGVEWPGRRLVAATAATAAALMATSGGMATYSTATFSLQVSQFLMLFMVVPTLALLSAPVTMTILVTRRSEDGERAATSEDLPRTLRSPVVVWLTDPLNALILVTVMVFSLYATPLLEIALRSAPVHLLVNLTFLGVGFLFWWAILGIEPLPPAKPSGYRLAVLTGFCVILAGIGARIYFSDVLLGGEWFTDLGWEWIEVPDDQRRGAMLMWAGVLLLGPILAWMTRRGRFTRTVA